VNEGMRRLWRLAKQGSFPLLLLTSACGGSLREVQGASYDLSGNESSVADRFEQEEPKAASASARCDYWQRRTYDAMRPQAIGMFIWPSDAFPTLRQWTGAKRDVVCAVHAKTDAQPDGLAVAVHVDGDNIMASVQTKMKCRQTRLDSDGQILPQQPDWQPCEARPLVGANVRLVFDDAQEVKATTDKIGYATFQLALVRWSDDALKSGKAQIALPDGVRTPVSLDALPQYAQWQVARVKAEETRRDEEQAATKFSRDSQTIDKMQGDLETMSDTFARLERTPDPWGDAQVPDLQRIDAARKDMDQLRQVVESDKPLDPQLEARTKALLSLLDQIGNRFSGIQVHIVRAEAHEKQVDAQAKREQQRATRGSASDCISRCDASSSRVQGLIDGSSLSCMEICANAANHCIDCCHATQPTATDEHCGAVCRRSMSAFTCN
jgi:hypothetical protein